MSENENEKREIEVVIGDDSNLNFSPIGDHISNLRPKKQEKGTIVIPEAKSKKVSKKDDDNDDEKKSENEDNEKKDNENE